MLKPVSFEDCIDCEHCAGEYTLPVEYVRESLRIQALVMALVKENSFLLKMQPKVKNVLREWANHSNFNLVTEELKK